MGAFDGADASETCRMSITFDEMSCESGVLNGAKRERRRVWKRPVAVTSLFLDADGTDGHGGRRHGGHEMSGGRKGAGRRALLFL